MRRTMMVVSLLLAFGMTAGAMAEEFPSRPVRVIIPFPPGGGIDLLVRAAGQELSRRWRVPVVIDNRAGAGGNIGTAAVARAAPDGYTLLGTVNQNITTARFLYRSLPYDPDSLVPISLMVQSDHILIAHPSVSATDLRELIALARSRPGVLTYGSFGTGTQPHLAYEMLNEREGLNLLHVPYSGIAPMLLALTRGEVALGTGSAGVAAELLRAGRVKALAVAGRRRLSMFPEVPTTTELGLGYVQASIWYALFAPPGTPSAITDRIGDDLRTVLREPDFAERQIHARGLDLVASSSTELVDVIREEVEAMRTMIRAAHIEAQ